MHPSHLDDEILTVLEVSLNLVVIRLIIVNPVNKRRANRKLKDGRRWMDNRSDGVANRTQRKFSVERIVGRQAKDRDVPDTGSEVTTVGIELAA